VLVCAGELNLSSCRMKGILLMCELMQPSYKRPTVTGNIYFAETFESEEDFKHR